MSLPSTADRVARRFEAAVLTAKWLRETRAEYRRLLMKDANMSSPASFGYDLRQVIAPFLLKLEQDIINMGVHVDAERSVRERLESMRKYIDAVADSLYKFSAANGLVSLDKGDPILNLIWHIQFTRESAFGENVKSLGDALKYQWYADGSKDRGIAERLLKKATPEEVQALSNDEDYGHTALRLRNEFYRRVNIDLIAKRTIKKTKLDWDPLKKFDFFLDVLKGPFSEEAMDLVHEPTFSELDVYGMKIVFQDDTVMGADKKTYIRRFDEAYAGLKRKKLDKVWYGTVLVRCKDCGGVNSNGASFGVGGEYYHGANTIIVYARPTVFVVELLVHELGHRYWYKHMTSEQRARFGAIVKVYKPRKSPPVPESKLQGAKKIIEEDTNSFENTFNRFEEAMGHRSSKSEQDALIDTFAHDVNALVLSRTDGVFRILSELTPSTWDASAKTWNRETDVEKAKDAYTGTDMSAEVELRRYCVKANVLKFFKEFHEAYGEHSEGVRSWLRDARILLARKEKAAFTWLEEIKKAEGRSFEEGDVRPVTPVSEYGKSNIEEAFAEVFAHYVLEHDMNRDQLESFRSVLSSTTADNVLARYLAKGS